MINKKIFLITGTRKGIGNALANYYLEQGHTVVGCSRRDSLINHSEYQHYSLDVSDEKAVIKMVRKSNKEHGGIDILLNNAGMAAMNAMLLTPMTTVQKVFNTNTFGTFLLQREVAKSMIKKKCGRIVNFTTVAVPMNLDGEAVYAASKAAIESLTKIGARELAPYGITVNAIGPTPIQTDLIKLVPQEKIDELVNRQAIHRLGEFADITNVIDFFIDDKSEFITGQCIFLGGVSG